jgi:hypothetical protein
MACRTRSCIYKLFLEARNRFPAWYDNPVYSQAESIPWNRFLGSIYVYKSGLCLLGIHAISQYVANFSLLKRDKINNLTGRSGSNSCYLRKDLKPFFMTLASDGTRRILYKVLSHFHEFCKKLRQYTVPPQYTTEPTLILYTSILPSILIQIYL